MTRLSQFASAAAMTAALSLVATPAIAAELTVPASPSAVTAVPLWNPGEATQNYHRRYRNRRSGVDAGDVLTGVLILGGIAAVASAVKNNDRRDQRVRYPDPRYRDPRYPDSTYRTDDVRGLDRAASICVSEIEREARVRSVDSVDRNATGWRVSGALFDGQGFTCSLGSDGRIEGIDYGAAGQTYGNYGASYDGQTYQGEDNQWDDDRYRSARAGIEGQGGYGPSVQLPPQSSERLPAYPGGPVEGDYGYDE